MDKELLAPEHFRKVSQDSRLAAEVEIGRVLTTALNEFRDNKIVPYLPNLQAVLIAIALAFDSVKIPGYEKVVRGVKLDETEARSIYEWVNEHQGSPKLSAVRDTVSWAGPHMVDIIREGLAVRSAVQDQSNLISLKHSKMVARTGLIFVEDRNNDRVYAYHYQVDDDDDVVLRDELGANFPRLAKTNGTTMKKTGYSLGSEDVWPHAPAVDRKEKFWESLNFTFDPNQPAFYFWCQLPAPFDGTIKPMARDALEGYLQKNVGQVRIF